MFRFGSSLLSVLFLAACSTPQISLPAKANLKLVADGEGKVLARMEGQEHFTGGERDFNYHYGAFATLGGEEKVREVLVKEAGKHIIELAAKRGP